MGNMLRRFWTPVCLSDDIAKRDGAPRKVRVFGEDFVAFRTPTARSASSMNAACTVAPSLTMARVEDCGIRCLYHGWKFGVDGTIQDMPNIRDTRLKDRLKAPTYPAREGGGLVWAYFGPPEKQPPFPEYRWMTAGEQPRKPVNIIFECNWVQLIEGSMDLSHLGIPHQEELTEARTGVYQQDAGGRGHLLDRRLRADDGDREHQLRFPLCRDPRDHRR